MVTVQQDGQHGWSILVDGKPTPADQHFPAPAHATERAMQIIGKRPLPQLVLGYLETALWASTDPFSGEPLDKSHAISDFSEMARASALEDCDDFLTSCAEDIGSVPQDLKTIGHDFFLTRNRHGAGFWDGDYPEPQAARLTAAAHAAGHQDVLPGADGKLELS